MMVLIFKFVLGVSEGFGVFGVGYIEYYFFRGDLGIFMKCLWVASGEFDCFLLGVIVLELEWRGFCGGVF